MTPLQPHYLPPHPHLLLDSRPVRQFGSVATDIATLLDTNPSRLRLPAPGCQHKQRHQQNRMAAIHHNGRPRTHASASFVRMTACPAQAFRGEPVRPSHETPMEIQRSKQSLAVRRKRILVSSQKLPRCKRAARSPLRLVHRGRTPGSLVSQPIRRSVILHQFM